jgi:tRNA pseudouridine38-40 synthase
VKRFLIGISYEGKNFHGFQEQPDRKTVEGTLKKLLKDYFAENRGWQAMSRTDKGVNAKINLVVANFKEDITKKFEEIKEKLNKEGIELLFIERVPINLPIRGLAKFKEYKYFLPKNLETYFVFNGEKNISVDKSVLNQIDWNKVKELKELFKGKKYVENFSKRDKTKKYSYITNFFEIDIKDKGDYIEFTVKGDKFYWEEVRRLINVFISYLTGYLTKEKLLEMFKEKKNAKPKAYPPEYLWLWNIELDL